MKRKKKRPVTLIEIMVVVLLIGLIGGALAFNMRGSIDKGKIFKTEQNIQRVQDTLMMENAANGTPLEDLVENPGNYLKYSPLIKDPATVLKDGWGKPLDLTIHDGEIKITSARMEARKKAQS